jgi:hypothetical protein
LETFTLALDQVKKSVTGKYYYDYHVTNAGKHEYRWESTGTVEKVAQGNFIVENVNV